MPLPAVDGITYRRDHPLDARDAVGDEGSVILRSAPWAMSYLPAVGFEAAPNAFVVKRSR